MTWQWAESDRFSPGGLASVLGFPEGFIPLFNPPSKDRTMQRSNYQFPEQLKFKHLAKHEIFMFPAGNGTPAMGPYVKISARRYVEATVRLVGERIVSDIKAEPVHSVGSINATVSDRVIDYVTADW